MSLQLPLVSVIVPVYNAEAFISDTLSSVIAQTYKNIEILVVDDGSQDRSAEIVQFIAQKDHRVILLQQSNAGVAAARNLAIQKSSGEYIAPIDADDIWFPQKIEKQIQCMLEADESVGLVYAWSVLVDEKGLIIGTHNELDFLTIHCLEGEVYPALVYRNLVGNASVPLIRRACFEQVGDYNCKLKEYGAQGCEDWDLYLRIAERYQFRVVPEFLIGYRQVTGSMSCNSNSMGKSYILVLEDAQQKHPELPNYLYQWSKSYFYLYLLMKSYTSGDYMKTLFWLYKVVRLDFTALLNYVLYKVFIMSILKLVAKPVASLFWSDHYSWSQFRKRFNSAQQDLTTSDIKREINITQEHPTKLYDRIILKRLSRVLQMCQMKSPSVTR